MKKLMIAAAIVCAAAMAQASAWKWSVSGMPPSGAIFYDKTSSATLKSTTSAATIYLFDAATVSQAALLAGLRDGTYADLSAATSVANSTLDSSSKLVSKSIESYGGTSGTYNFYMAVMDTAGDVFISDIKSGTAQQSSEAAIAFSAVATATQTNFTADPTKSYSSAGWYAAAPEPTSGLLLLLGMGALALRRRRA